MAMDVNQIRPLTLDEEKILREGLSDVEVTYENVATLTVEDPFANLEIVFAVTGSINIKSAHLDNEI